ncbi:D-methionine transport system substrate-binding protein [Azospirillum agricola]|uniref:MetQ/NlpA family ABC transporter substrate-binding protein n=1 Tax=Azospirillum agricola TaxID=1720247 RepID=UPI001AE40F4E|nr:MetQ/NlpA family ABC transporter substrate-binding protein [Azospirillum agricola]MBP2230441.1 D-methionine transport system substrate-binding protein [Azospirillum agricola]
MRLSFFALAVAGATGFAWSAGAGAETLKVGVTPGPHAQILEAVAKVAAGRGLDLKILEFTDGATINAVTASGELQANAFQHLPYLQYDKRNTGYDLVPVAETILLPMAAYSRRVKALADLPAGARIGIPNDSTNASRALLLLQESGLITLRGGGDVSSTPLDIEANPKRLTIAELEGAQLPRVLDELDAAVITSHFAIEAKLNPLTDSIARESPQSKYNVVLVVRRQDGEKPWVAPLVDAYRSAEVKRFVADTFHGSILTVW